MNILVTSNNEYAFSTKVLLNSICKNNTEDINVYFLYNNFSESNMDSINLLKKLYNNLSISYIYIDTKDFYEVPIQAKTNKYITIETYFRLAAGRVLPPQVEKILYLDTDIIVNGSLKQLYNHKFASDSLALVCEDFGLQIAKNLRRTVFRNLGLNKKHVYFNAGVMLLNLKELRKKYKLSDYIEYIRINHSKIIFHDQDVMNKMYEGAIEYEDFNQYNCRPFFYPYSSKYQKLVQNATIIHYGEKPWNDDFTDLGGEIFWDYAQFDSNQYIKFKFKNNEFIKKHKIEIILKRLKRNLKLLQVWTFEGKKRFERKDNYNNSLL